jgi:hypothetical protein
MTELLMTELLMMKTTQTKTQQQQKLAVKLQCFTKIGINSSVT